MTCGACSRGRNGFGGFDARLEIREFRGSPRQTGALYARLDEFFDMRGHQMQPAELARERLLETSAREFVANGETVQIEVENTQLVVLARIAQPHVGIEPAGTLGECLVERLRIVCGRNRDDVRVGGASG